MISKTCDVCGQKAKPADNEAQANRNLGLHKRALHVIAGSEGHPREAQPQAPSSPEGQSPLTASARRAEFNRRRREQYARQKTEERARKRREYGIAWRARQKLARQQTQPGNNGDAVTLRFICPECHARVYTAAGK